MQTDQSVPVVNTMDRACQAYVVDEELTARRWLRRNGYYWAKSDVLSNHFYHHVMSIARMPRGSADRAGSQQCAFSMLMPSEMAAFQLMAKAPLKGNVKYTVNGYGVIEWKPSPSIKTWYIDDQKALVKFLAMHRRGLGPDMYGASKAVAPTGGYWESNVVLQIIPPFIAELCQRSHDRLILEVTCNLMTYNEQGILKLPPNFPYGNDAAQTFISEVRRATKELAYRGAPLTKRFRDLVGVGAQDESSGAESDWDG